jgi:hypothetical protein
LPPATGALTASDFEAVLSAFAAALGEGAVLRTEEQVREFRDPYIDSSGKFGAIRIGSFG